MTLSQDITALSGKLAALVPLAQALEAPTIPTLYVTSLADSGTGTLREALEREDDTPLRVLSQVTGTVALTSRLYARRSNVILDLPGLLVTGGCIDWQAPAHDIEVRNLRMRDCPDDGLLLRPGVKNVHVHHCTISRCTDELVAIGAQDVLVEYCLLYDGLPPNGAAIWTVTDSEADRVVMRQNLVLNAFKRLGNANDGQDVSVYENVFVNCAHATFNMGGAHSELWHNVYVQGLDSGFESSFLKAAGGFLALGNNLFVKLDGSTQPMEKQDAPAGRYTQLPPPQSDDFAWQLLLGDLYANAGASVRDDADNAALDAGRNGTGRLPAPLAQYIG